MAFNNLFKDISTPKATFKNILYTVGCEKALYFGEILKCHAEAVCERRRESEEERECRATVIYVPHPTLCCLLMHFRAILLANCSGNGELVCMLCDPFSHVH